MALIDVVKYDGNDEEFAWKFPSEDLRLGTQLVVKTAQTAFFIRSGKVLDQFEPGRVTLKSGNIPLLNKIINGLKMHYSMVMLGNELMARFC